MTIAELQRAVASRNRVRKQEAQERASYDYILADLIGRSVGRIYSSATKLPPINEAYPSLFSEEMVAEEIAQKKAELSSARFKQFADSFNRRWQNKE